MNTRRIKLFKGSTISQAVTFMIILIVGYPILVRSSNTWIVNLGILLGISCIFVLAMGLYLFWKKWEVRNKSDYRVVPFYLSILLFYSLAYTFAAVASPVGGFISGLHPVMEPHQTYQTTDLIDIYSALFNLFFDSIYYSVSIMTTLGDGSIQPKGIIKLIVASHVGFTFFVTVYGVAEYFSNQSSKELRKELAILKLDLPKTNINTVCESTSNIKVNSLSKRFYLSFKGLFTGRYV